MFNIGSEEEPIIINLKKVGMWRKRPRQNGWQLFDKIAPMDTDVPLEITDDQYDAIVAMKLEHKMEKQDREMREEREEVMEDRRRMMVIEELPRIARALR